MNILSAIIKNNHFNENTLFHMLCEDLEGTLQELSKSSKKEKKQAAPYMASIKNIILLAAALKGNISTVKAAIHAGANINAEDKYGRTALILAAGQEGALDIVQTLIKKGADIQKHNEATDPLGIAAHCGHTDIVSFLLTAGADVNACPNPFGFTPLHRATNHIETLKALLAADADIHIRTAQGESILMVASQRGHTEAVQFFLNRGMDIQSQDHEGNSALNAAFSHGQVEVFKLLVDAIPEPKEFEAFVGPNLSLESVPQQEKAALIHYLLENSLLEKIAVIYNGGQANTKATAFFKNIFSVIKDYPDEEFKDAMQRICTCLESIMELEGFIDDDNVAERIRTCLTAYSQENHYTMK